MTMSLGNYVIPRIQFCGHTCVRWDTQGYGFGSLYPYHFNTSIVYLVETKKGDPLDKTGGKYLDYGIITYDGLERCILNSQSYVNTNTLSAYPTTYFEEEETSCSSNKNVGGSFYSDWITKKDNEETDTWGECKLASPEPFYARGAYATQFSDVEAMKEKFSKLLLGDDVTGGQKGKTSALAISNAIINLAGKKGELSIALNSELHFVNRHPPLTQVQQRFVLGHMLLLDILTK